jgi:CheY-like chemotaxis protein
MRQRPNILVIGDDTPRITRLRESLGPTSRVVQAEDLQQALKRLALDDHDAVFADWQFHCGTWREALRSIAELYPDLPVIVISNSEALEMGNQEWREAIAAGAFDLLPSHYGEFEVISLAEQAVASARARALLATA